MKEHKIVGAFALILLALCVTGIAQAQTWNTNVLTWEAPTTCTSGQPISNCPVTGYRVERSASTGGTYAAVGTSASLTYTHQSAAAGQNCYRVIALSAQGESVPSNIACKTNTQPSGPPNPPSNLQVTNQTVYELYYDTRKRSWELGDRAGFADIGTSCIQESRLRKTAYYEVRKESVRLFNPRNPAKLFARCG